MKKGFLALLVTVCFLTGFQCNKDNLKMCYKGRLEIKGICMNYTIKILSGNIDTSLIERTWTDPHTNIRYDYVFALGTVCSFPPDLQQGDEFYFTLNSKPEGPGCVVCMAYYPTPAKALNISVSKLPCE